MKYRVPFQAEILIEDASDIEQAKLAAEQIINEYPALLFPAIFDPKPNPKGTTGRDEMERAS